jgi:hypothetical protein
MTKIIGFLGRKQSGKNTCSNMMHGFELQKREMIRDFKIEDTGKLAILTQNAADQVGWGEFDVTRKDDDFAQWAHMNMWPFIKNYAFADELKRMAIDLFDVPPECVFGTDEQKNQVQEHLRWENMPVIIDTDSHLSLTNNHYGGMGKNLATKLYPHDDGSMTAREFMQFFGSEIMRKMHGPVWINKTLRQISMEQSAIAIISDVRFPNEAEAIKRAGGIIVKLNRKQKTKDLHQSEEGVDLVDASMIDYNIQNNKKGYGLDSLQSDIKQIYDTVVL